MSVLSKFEGAVEGAVDGAAAAVFSSPIEPAQIARKAEKQMKRERLVGSGRQYAPTLYNVLVNERDDKRLIGFYPTMASEIENYLYAKGTEAGMEFDGRPLVRFIPDPGLKKGRFDVIAEVVAAPIIKKLRAEEMEYYGLAPKGAAAAAQPIEDRNDPFLDLTPEEPGDSLSGFAPRSPAAVQADRALGSRASALPELTPPSSRGVPVRLDAKVPPVGAIPIPFPASANSQAASGDRANTPHTNPSEPAALSVIGNASLYNVSEQRAYRLKSRKLTAGRGTDNDIVLNDANASRVHVRFSQDATGTWKMTDLGSTNGTLLNGKAAASAILRSGDEITVGTTVLQFNE